MDHASEEKMASVFILTMACTSFRSALWPDKPPLPSNILYSKACCHSFCISFKYAGLFIGPGHHLELMLSEVNLKLS